MSAASQWMPEGGPLPTPAERLRGRSVLVTGAAQGIGRAIACLFAAEGAKIALLDCNEAALAEVAEETGGVAVRCDLRYPDEIVAAIADVIHRTGGLDGLVNAAGVHAAGSITDTTLEKWREVMAVNLDAPFLLCREVLPHLRAAGAATIVNISSGVGLSPFAERAAYATSKGGLITLGKVLAMELAPRIRVNTICPGLIDTPMVAALPLHNSNPDLLKRYALQRLGRDVEVAQAALFLSSTASSFVTGITMAVDGGRTFH
ncbi:SDR family NAD(P)-dependent oxidoreductase [Microvirga antarctica]|uniref:SDR family NAD(P)-dependent oxidoreductase n=1 Tax=Microvirga antarctica TaxID=2819233 RepID=UPI001FEB8639|nr:SDR family oxidoreductase [Microvirga antarctica]